MKSYKVSLFRNYVLTIDTNSECEVKQNAEFVITGKKMCYRIRKRTTEH